MRRRRALVGSIGFTTRASCLLAAGATALSCGIALGIVDLVRAGLLMIAMPVLAAVVVLRSRVQITNRRRVEPSRTQAGGSVTVHLTLSNRSRLPSGPLMLEDELPGRLRGTGRFVLDGLLSRQDRTVSYRMPRLPRGRYRVGPLHVRLTDPFHLVDVRRSFTSTAEVIVTPIIDLVRRGDPPRSADTGDEAGSHSVGTRGADDASTREYRVGDDLRKIHWRSTARTGRMMVRQEERPWHGQYTVLLDRRGAAHNSRPASSQDPDERSRSSLEWAISAAAGLATAAIVAGREITVLDDPAHPLGRRFADTATLGDHLASVTALPDAALLPRRALSAALGYHRTVVAVLGRLRPDDVHALTDVQVGAESPAAALLLDTGTWGDGWNDRWGQSGLEDAERALLAAGWRVVVARRGAPVAERLHALLVPGSTPVSLGRQR